MIDSFDQRPLRVAQVLQGLVAGGIETWLVSLLRRFDPQRVQVDFITSNPTPCYYDEVARQHGARIICCPHPKRPWRYLPALYHTFRRHGPYDVVHTHTEHFAGFVLPVARAAGVPMRIAHSHSDTSLKQSRASARRRFYLRMMRRSIHRNATLGVAVSDRAGASLFPNWRQDARWRVVYCGVETDSFHTPLDRATVRRRLGLADDALVMCHLGTFREPKNHAFIVRVAAEVMAQNPHARLVLMSDGPLRRDIERQTAEAGITEKTVFTGFIDQPTEILRAADIFLFPSLWEGLPLAVVEAQAAGLPCVISDAITPEVVILPEVVRRLPLQASAAVWAEAAQRLADAPRPSAQQMLAEVEASPLTITNSARAIEATYRGSSLTLSGSEGSENGVERANKTVLT